MSEIANLQIAITSREVEVATKRLKDLEAAGKSTEQATLSLQKAQARLGSQMERAAAAEMAKAKRASDELAKVMAAQTRAMESQSGIVEKLAGGFKGMAAPMAAAAAAGMSLNSIISETVEFDNLIARLRGVTGGSVEARKAFDDLEKISDDMVFTENELVEAYLRLQQTGLDPSERSLRAFANIASGTGKSLEHLTEMTLSASMGVYRGLKDLGIKAEAEGNKVKMTYKGVTTTIDNSAEAIQGFLVKIGETDYAGAAAAQLDTMGGAVKQLKDELGDLAREVGRSAIGDAIKMSIKGTADAINLVTNAYEALLATLSKKPPEMSADRMGSINSWIRGATGWGEDGGDDGFAKIASTLEDLQKMAHTSGQANLEKYLSMRKSIMDASVTQDFDSRAALKDLDAWYTQVSGGGESRGAKKPAFDAAQFAKDLDYRRKMEENAAIRKAGEWTAEDSNAEEEYLQKLLDKEAELSRAELKRQDEAKRARDAKAEELAYLVDGFKTEQELIKDAEAKKLQLVREARDERLLSAEQEAELKVKIAKDTADKERALDAARVESSLQSGQAIFGNLANAAKNVGGEQSSAYRTLFSIQKGFAIASGTVAMYQAMAKGLEKGWPLGIPEMLAGAAQGAGLLAQITSTNYSGAYDRGGYIPGGSVGVVGEYGPELVRGPAQVTGREETAALGRGQPVTVVVAPDQAAAEQFLHSTGGDRAFLALAARHSTAIRRMVAG